MCILWNQLYAAAVIHKQAKLEGLKIHTFIVSKDIYSAIMLSRLFIVCIARVMFCHMYRIYGI